LKGIRMQSYGFDLRAQQKDEAAFRQLAHDLLDSGDEELPARLLDALSDYATGKDVSDDERKKLDFLVTQVGQGGTTPREQLSLMVAFAVKRGWGPILEGVLGTPSEADRARLDPAEPPGTAAIPVTDDDANPER
jgi:hypothetical protein